MESVVNISIPGPIKLPLEILGLILMKVDEDYPFEELKKCRLISPRHYKAVQDLFQDEFAQKFCTHFDGSNLNFTKSRTFGMNIFGSYKLNFSTVKISRSEFYLMKSWLEKLIPTRNLQTLELKDNHLNWKEVILVLKKFPSIVNLKFIQTSDNIEVAEEIFKLFLIKSKPNTGGYRARVKEQFAKSEEFLPNLKNFEAQIVHIRILNILSFIVSRATCQLESFSMKLDIKGVNWRSQRFLKSIQNEENTDSQISSLKIQSLNHFKKFSKWLKNLKIMVNFDFEYIYRFPNNPEDLLFFKSILQIFSKPDKLTMFTNIENLKLKVPKLDFRFRHNQYFNGTNENGLFEFIKFQKNLLKIDINSTISSVIDEPLQENNSLFHNIMKNLMVTPTSTFGYKISSLGFGPILDFSENLSKLHITHRGQTNWHFSNPEIPVFPNCRTLLIIYEALDQDNLQVREMIQKFPNLLKLSLMGNTFMFIGNTPETRPFIISNNDLKLIIKHYKNLKLLHLVNVFGEFEDYDSGLTGLSWEAIEARRDNLGLPITHENRIGPPISSLKDLESLAIISNYFNVRITDLSARHAFDKMIKMKFLNFGNTMITLNGCETIVGKMKSKNLVDITFNYDTYRILPN